MANHGSVSSLEMDAPSVLTVQPTHGTNEASVPPPTISQLMVSGQNRSTCCWLNRKQSIWLSTILIISGVLGFTGAGMAIYGYAVLSETGAGIWCGIVFVTTGGVAIAAGRHGTIRLIRATVATAVLSIFFAITLIVIGSIGFTNGSDCWQYCYYYNDDCHCKNVENIGIVGSIILVTSGSAALVFAFWLMVIASISLGPRLKLPIKMPKKPMVNKVTPIFKPKPPLQQTVASSPMQGQPIIIFSTCTQPTVLFGHDPTKLPHGQPAVNPVIMGQQQNQPIVFAPGNQPQSTVVFRQDPQEGVTVNINTLPGVHSADKGSLSQKNPPENNEASHESKKGVHHT